MGGFLPHNDQLVLHNVSRFSHDFGLCDKMIITRETQVSYGRYGLLISDIFFDPTVCTLAYRVYAVLMSCLSHKDHYGKNLFKRA